MSNNIIDKGNDTVTNTSDSINKVITNVSSFTDLLNSDNLYYYILAIFIFLIIYKKIWSHIKNFIDYIILNKK